MKVLMTGSYASPLEFGGNRSFFVQARELRNQGVDVQILTCPYDGTWQGQHAIEGQETLENLPYSFKLLHGIPYHLVRFPAIWDQRSLTDVEWESAVAWGTSALRTLAPQIVHLQFWRGHWWLLEAAQRLQIPTAYTAHDFGLGCLRTVLVKGDGKLCDGIPEEQKCSTCIVQGRNLLGKINELAVSLPLFDKLTFAAYGKTGTGRLARNGAVRLPVRQRVADQLRRSKQVLQKLNVLFSSNPMASRFFAQLGMRERDIHEIPWYSEINAARIPVRNSAECLCLGYLSRISEEKGLHVLIAALEKIPTTIRLKIAGGADSDYARNLKKRAQRLSQHKIEWLGWIPDASRAGFFSDIHLLVVPSQCMDNCPLSLVESLSNGRAVICTDVPSVAGIVKHNQNGLLFGFNEPDELSAQITRAVKDPNLAAALAKNTCIGLNSAQYASRVQAVYLRLLTNSTDRQPVTVVSRTVQQLLSTSDEYPSKR